MTKTNSQIRQESLDSLKGRWGSAIFIVAIYMIICSVSSLIPVVGFLSWLIIFPLIYGLYGWFLKFYRDGSTSPEITTLFDGYLDYGRVFMTYLLVVAYTFLWTLLFVVPGIIKSLSYSMTLFILADEPGLRNDEAIERSMAMMQGHKMRLFLMCLNFTMWTLLALATLGIALLWVYPYMYNTLAIFYEDVKSEYESRQVVIEDDSVVE